MPENYGNEHFFNHPGHEASEAAHDLIRDVWATTLEDEFHQIRKIVQEYPYVAMDTEFPGVVAKPVGEFRSHSDYQYTMLRTNVSLLKIIQVGITFYNENGESPSPFSTWQFNFKFRLSEDMYADDSIQLLQNSGINFELHKDNGIIPQEFAELLTTSGIILNDQIRWISFHSNYDFGYLLKMVTGQDLPLKEMDFFDLLLLYFPKIYDVKYLMKSCRTLKGGLQEVSDILSIDRIGPQHQAGSDSKLTGAAFFKMREDFFEDNIDDVKYCGHLYGLAGLQAAVTVDSTRKDTNNTAGAAGKDHRPVATVHPLADSATTAANGGSPVPPGLPDVMLVAAAAAAAAVSSTTPQNSGANGGNNNTNNNNTLDIHNIENS